MNLTAALPMSATTRFPASSQATAVGFLNLAVSPTPSLKPLPYKRGNEEPAMTR